MDENARPGDEQEPGSSGNRWEPTSPETQPAANPYAAAASSTTETTAAAPSSRPTWLTRARAAVAGSAVAALLVGGLGGFAAGRATAGSDGGRPDHQGVPTGFEQGDHGLPPGGQLGQAPDGQVPGMPGQDDGLQDGGTDTSNT